VSTRQSATGDRCLTAVPVESRSDVRAHPTDQLGQPGHAEASPRRGAALVALFRCQDASSRVVTERAPWLPLAQPVNRVGHQRLHLVLRMRPAKRLLFPRVFCRIPLFGHDSRSVPGIDSPEWVPGVTQANRSLTQRVRRGARPPTLWVSTRSHPRPSCSCSTPDWRCARPSRPRILRPPGR
jgi:hypothetical protein